MYNKILVPVDVSTMDNATRLCKQAKNLGAQEIRLVTVMPDYGMPMVASFFPNDAQQQLKKELSAVVVKLAEDNLPGENTTTTLRQGKRAKEILAEADEWQPDLILIGCRTKTANGGHRTMGSCSSSVADRASCSVLLMK